MCYLQYYKERAEKSIELINNMDQFYSYPFDSQWIKNAKKWHKLQAHIGDIHPFLHQTIIILNNITFPYQKALY